jgi:hypothetical protein
MRKRTRTYPSSARRGLDVVSNNFLVGTWEQEPNPGGTTTVAYIIRTERGKFVVQGKDEEDATPLEVSRIRGDGQSLHFTTVFPPTGHKSKHVLTALSKNRMKHHVSCTYAEARFSPTMKSGGSRRADRKKPRHDDDSCAPSNGTELDRLPD